MIKPMRIALVTFTLIVLAGCDQAETSAKQLLNTAADAAKQAVDETHKAVTQVLEETRQDLSMAHPESPPKTEKADQEI